jgi:late competence protein required for DNA uptake (superfamily II DNA/RNA helicase)
MLEEKKETESTMGILREAVILEPDDSVRAEENRRSEMIKQIREGAFQTH